MHVQVRDESTTPASKNDSIPAKGSCTHSTPETAQSIRKRLRLERVGPDDRVRLAEVNDLAPASLDRLDDAVVDMRDDRDACLVRLHSETVPV